MNYLKCYYNLILKAKNRDIVSKQYYERHHIIPKSIFNNKNAYNTLNLFNIQFKYGKDNIVHLLLREHFIVHLLLVKIFKNINTDAYEKMLYAANFLKSRGNSKKYKFLKIAFKKMMSTKLTGKVGRATGSKWSKKRRKLGQVHLKGKTYEQIHGNKKGKLLRDKRSKTRLGKTLEEICGYDTAKEMKKKLANREFTPEWRKKISQRAKEKKLSQFTKDKISKFMSNRDLSPNVHQDLYMFEHKDSKERIIKRKIDMKKDYGCNLIYQVIKGKRNHSMGWTFVKKMKE